MSDMKMQNKRWQKKYKQTNRNAESCQNVNNKQIKD